MVLASSGSDYINGETIHVNGGCILMTAALLLTNYNEELKCQNIAQEIKKIVMTI